MRPFVKGLKALNLVPRHKVLCFQRNRWCCGYQNLHIITYVVEHHGPRGDPFFTQMPKGFVLYMLSVVDADQFVCVIRPHGEDF